jgi:hypothetical protein
MTAMFNALLECLVTGLFTALWLAFFSFIGLVPMMFISYAEEPKEEEDFDE